MKMKHIFLVCLITMQVVTHVQSLKLRKQEEQLNAIQNEFTLLENQFSNVQNQLENSSCKIAKGKQQKIEDKLENVKSKLKDAQIEEKDNEIEELKGMINDLAQKNKEAIEKINTLEQKLQTEVGQVKTDYNDAITRLTSLESKNGNLENQVNQVETKYNNANNRISSLEQKSSNTDVHKVLVDKTYSYTQAIEITSRTWVEVSFYTVTFTTTEDYEIVEVTLNVPYTSLEGAYKRARVLTYLDDKIINDSTMLPGVQWELKPLDIKGYFFNLKPGNHKVKIMAAVPEGGAYHMPEISNMAEINYKPSITGRMTVIGIKN